MKTLARALALVCLLGSGSLSAQIGGAPSGTCAEPPNSPPIIVKSGAAYFGCLPGPGGPLVWTQIFPAAGGNGGTLNIRGPWSNVTAYGANDVVTYSSANYIAIAPSTGIAPTDTTKWAVFYGATLGYTAENVANKGQPSGYPGLDGSGKLPLGTIPSGLPYQAPLTYSPENVANKGAAGGYAGLDSGSKIPAGNIPVLPYQPPLAYTPENSANKGAAGGYAGLDSGAKVLASAIPSGLPYQAPLGFTPENSANKGQPSGYPSLDGGGKVPSSQLPAGLGGGPGGPYAFVVTTTATSISVGVGDLSTISGAQQVLGSPTITQAAGNTDTGSFFMGVSASGGTFANICYYTAGINPANWTQSGMTCSAAAAWPLNTATRQTYTVPVTSGSVGTAVRITPDVEVSQAFCGTGLVLDASGLGCKIDPAYSLGGGAAAWVVYRKGAVCNGSTPSTTFDLPTSGAAAPACFGTNARSGLLTLTPASAGQAYDHFTLPSNCTGTLHATLQWIVNTDSNAAHATTITLGVAQVAAGTSADPVLTGTVVSTSPTSAVGVSMITSATIANAGTCTPGRELYYTILEDNASTVTGTIGLISISWTSI